MHQSLLLDIVIIFGLSIAVLFVCRGLRIPSIVGYLVTGILAGPHGLALIGAVQEVELLAEIGVVILLFAIGLEFSLRRLLKIRRAVLIGGSLQVVLTVFAVLAWHHLLGNPLSASIFIGFLISLSSTAIVLKLIQERGEIDTPQGRTTVAILIFQDLIIVPMILFTPLLAGEAKSPLPALLTLAFKALTIIILVYLAARWLVPGILFHIARTRSRELFLIGIFGICLAVVWLTAGAGLSLALGAFLAGLIISESDYSLQALGSILPFRDVFISFFFVSIGMLLDISFFMVQPLLIISIAIAVIFIKTLIAALVTMVLGYPLRTAIMVGFGLSQIGEFSFILSGYGMEYGILDQRVYQIFLSVSVLTMMSTAFVLAAASPLLDRLLRFPLPAGLRSGLRELRGGPWTGIRDHLIILGFGITGRHLARAAALSRIEFIVIEMNPETVREEKKRGLPIFFGDASQPEVLEHAGIKQARMLVVAVSDPPATRRIIASARKLNSALHIIVRTRYLREIQPLYDLGSNEVIPEDFETSIEIFTRVLTRYLVPHEEIDALIAQVRYDNYEILRGRSVPQTSFADLRPALSDLEIKTIRVAEGCPASGRTLAELSLNRRYGVAVLAITHGRKTLSNPAGNARIQAGDRLILLGPPARIGGVLERVFHNNDGKNR